MKTLQILINHYKESLEIVERFLDSLNMQQNIEFEVLIISDGGDVHLEIPNKYHFPIKYTYMPHSGVCHTRNILLQESSADYIMFCDIDDIFSKSDGLYSLMTQAEQTNADIIGSPYLCESYINNNYYYKTYNKDVIRVHGKIFRHQYLIDNDIKYPDEMEINGDMYFLWLAYKLTKKIIWIDNNFYIWKWNENSVTRTQSFHHMWVYDRTVKCYLLLLENLKQRKRFDLYQEVIATLISMMYVDATDPKWYQAPKEYQIKVNKIINTFLKEYFPYYKTLSENLRYEAYKVMINYVSGERRCGKFEDIFTWGEERIYPSDILIIGYGTVGHNLEKELFKLKPAIYDKYKNKDTRFNDKYNIAFVCVDTPNNENSFCDLTEVKNAIEENNADIFILKSTILPGSTEKLCEETSKIILFSPEYYGGTQHCNNFEFDFTILGGDKEACYKVIQKLQQVYDGRHTFHVTDAKTAELAKYMENSWLATKVSFCNQFCNIAEDIGVNYEELRELFILDPRVNPSHTFVYRDHPYWDSHCLNKDVPAIAETYDAKLLKDVIKFNEEQKA